MDITIRSKTIKDITLLELFKEDGILKKPMVISYHGWAGYKEEKLLMAYELALEGYFVVIPDAYLHGRRRLQAEPITEPLSLNQFPETVQKTSNEINQIIESYRNNNQVDMSNIGLTGTSMGGCIVFDYLARQDQKVKAAVSIISTPDWLSIIFALEEFVKKIEDERLVPAYFTGNIEFLKESAKTSQPVDKNLDFLKIPLLMLNGESDNLMPIDRVRDFYNKSKEQNKEIKLVTYPNLGHTETTDMVKEIITWFKLYLNSEP